MDNNSTLIQKLKSGNVTVPEGRIVSHSNGNPQIGGLKNKLDRLQRENAHLKSKLEKEAKPTPRVTLAEDGLAIRAQLNQGKQVFSNITSLTNNKDFKVLVSLLQPLVLITNGLLAGKDLLDRKPELVRDSNGKLTKTRALDEEGRPKSLPSLADRLDAAYNAILSDPNCFELLKQLEERISHLDQVKPVVTRSPQSTPSRKDEDVMRMG